MNTNDMMENIAKSYISEKDFELLRQFMITKNITCISFREAGEDTINKLEKGAGAKPHSILEKTIKEIDFDAEQGSASYAGIPKKERLYGLVAKREKAFDKDKRGKIIGLYLTSFGRKVFTTSNILTNCEIESENEHSYIQVNESNIPRIIDLLEKCDCNYYPCFFTGDYDVHDMMQSNKIVVSEVDMQLLGFFQEKSKQQWKTNFMTGNLPNGFEEKFLKDYQRIQHGPQYNYIAQMVNENYQLAISDDQMQTLSLDDLEGKITRFNTLVKKVAEPLFDIVKVTAPRFEKSSSEKGSLRFSIISTKTELSDMYQKFGLEIKNVWREDGSYDMEKFFENNEVRIREFVDRVRKCNVYNANKDSLEKLMSQCNLDNSLTT